MKELHVTIRERIQHELELLDRETIQLNGTVLKPSQCYHLDTDPLHLLFNTNCPDKLKETVTGIVQKYYPSYESSTPENG